MILRRLYSYIVAAVALVLTVVGLSLLGVTLLLFVFNDPAAQESRTQLAAFAAMALVAGPVWGLHLWWAGRHARRDPSERTSAIRRLYLYFACLASSLASLVLSAVLIGTLAAALLDGATLSGQLTAQLAWALAVVAAAWGGHLLLARRDRALAGEEGASATIRRWYYYAALLAGFLLMLSGAQGLLASGWLHLAGEASAMPWAEPVAALLAGAAFWAVHAWQVARPPLLGDDLRSTLRAFEGFVALFVLIVASLTGASTVLYYLLARIVGADLPQLNLAAALAPPAATALVYGAAWPLLSRRLRRDAATGEGARQAGVRRLYTNLVALVSLAVLGVGVGAVLWTAGEQVEARLIGVAAPPWRNLFSLGVTMAVVGGAVWATRWRPAPPPAERQALSRRLYLYAVLFLSVLAVLAGGVGVLNAILREALSAQPSLADPANLDVARFLAVLVTAAAIGLYHLQALRGDLRAREPAAAAPVRATHRYELQVVGAETEDLRRALAALPAGATYTITEQPA